LVFSHSQNSFDKKDLLNNYHQDNHIKESNYKPEFFVREKDIYQFFMSDIDKLLDQYTAGSIENKPDVKKKIIEKKKKIEDVIKANENYYNIVNKIQIATDPKYSEERINELTQITYQLSNENNMLREKLTHLESILKKIISEKKEVNKQQQTEN
jgi:hypothetical protein